MKSLLLKLILLFAVGFVFTAQMNAQLCGKYPTTLQIKTFDDKPVENAVIQLFPVENDETRGRTFIRDEIDLSKFTITFYEGHQLTATYKLIIYADGFETLEKEIKFPHCKRQNFDIKLNAKLPINAAILSGTVYDAVGAVVPKAKITVIYEKGEIFKTLTNDAGIYGLYLPFNNYRQIKSADFRIAKL